MATKKPAPALAHYAAKEPTPTILEFCAWLKSETGVDVDPMSVHLGSLLRGVWQKSPDRQAERARAALLAGAGAEGETPVGKAPMPAKPRRRPAKDAA
jgi:hypothetical protein